MAGAQGSLHQRTVLRAEPPLSRAAASDLATAAAVLALAAIAGFAVSNQMWEFLIALVWGFGSVALYLRWPAAGFAALLALWAAAPFLRRVFDYTAFSLEPDVLSIAPFVATGAIGLVAWRASSPDRRARGVFWLTCAGLGLGIPIGLLDPFPVVFAAIAYGSAASVLFIGYADARRGRPVIGPVVLGLLVPIAAYTAYQWLAPRVPAWDELWMRTSGIKTVGDKEHGTFRAFGPLNSPVTLASFAAVVVAMSLVARRLDAWRLLGAAVAVTVLFATGVRSAWLALAAALVVVVVVSRGRALVRVLCCGALVGALFLAAGGSTAGQQVIDRASTLTTIATTGAQSDVSLTERLNQVTVFGPRALVAPLGHGLGSVGQAAKVSSRPDSAPFADNGYLMLLWQVGPVGLLLVVGAMCWVLATALSGGDAAELGRRMPFVAALLAGGFLMFASDALYGLPAVIIWYCAGVLLAMTGNAERTTTAGSQP